MPAEVPHPALIALALAVVQSKPDSRMGIDEWLRLLRKHIAKGRRENALSTAYRRLDRSSYWRDLYEQSQVQLEASKVQISSLQQQLGDPDTKPKASTRTTSTRKRKLRTEDEDFDKRLTESIDQIGTMTFPVIHAAASDADVGQAGEQKEALLHHIFCIRQSLLDTSTGTVNSMTYHVIAASRNIAHVITHTLHDPENPLRLDDATIRANIVACLRAVAIILAGIAKLTVGPEFDDGLGALVHAIVEMVQSCLLTFDILILAKLDRVAKEKSSSLKPEKQTSISTAGDSSILLLVAFIEGCINELDAACQSHSMIFEGITYLIMERLGDHLFVAVFGHARGSTIEAEISKGSDLRGSSHGKNVRSDQGLIEQPEWCRLMASSSYLIRILRVLVANAPEQLIAGSVGHAKQKRTISRKSSKGILSIAARRRLQNTLLKCFDASETSGEHDIFDDCLHKVMHDEAEGTSKVNKNMTTDQWFVHEVWRLVGWEILSKET